MKNITYIFIKGRKDRIINKQIEAKEFFYGLPSLDDKKYKINILEFIDTDSVFNLIFRLLDKIMSRIFSLPFYSSKIVNMENFKTLKKTDHLILVSESTAFSVLPILLLLRIVKRIKVSLFVMGMYSKELRFKRTKKIHQGIVKFLTLYIDNIFFLGKGELKIAKKLHRKKQKLHYFPFSIDTEFWTLEEKLDLDKNKKIIFVGNDGNRNISLLESIARSLPKYEFVFVSNLKEVRNIKLPNVKVHKGAWGNNLISDKDLRKIYSEGRLTIIPLKESTQPSGQSVALQSMSLGIPVIISDTEGFWDRDAFIDGVELFFVKNNSLEEWVQLINEKYNDIELLKQISYNSKNKINNYFNLEKFNKKLIDFIEK
tara:strand:+ start:2703 stop:3815 length:1113 start_codon:yes stop_codon:yes gene_type:complete